MINFIAFQLFFYVFLTPAPSSAADTLAANQSLSGDQILVSLNGNFEMGFFRPGNSSNYYIGIWYNKTRVTSETVVWVANRETPISDRFSSKLRIIDGNLVLLNESNNQIWSTNMISTATPASVVLLDDGNLVLRYGSPSNPPVWQSFDNPTHTFLPGGKLGYDKRTNTSQVLTSWRSVDDPGVGLFSLELDPNYKQYLIKWNRSVQYWTSGSWNDRDKLFSLVPEMRLNFIYNFSYVDNENETYFTYSLYNPSIISRFIIDVPGQIKQLSWLDITGQWNLFWSQPRSFCDVYGGCGAFGVCNEQVLPFCTCLTDFEPRSQSDWNLGDFSGGCVRKTVLNCNDRTKKPIFSLSYFQNTSAFSFAETEVQQLDESACRSECLNYCGCSAYTFISNICQHWDQKILNNKSLRLFSYQANLDKIYIKVSSSDHRKTNTKVPVAGVVAGCLCLVFLCIIGVIFYRRMIRRDRGVLSEEDRKGLDVPFFEFKRILSATENFSLANKLGQGGFGPVYKDWSFVRLGGVRSEFVLLVKPQLEVAVYAYLSLTRWEDHALLVSRREKPQVQLAVSFLNHALLGTFPGGAEMAVKRLSSQSGQGLKEFKNEVLLIAKLQHRNLVRLLGYSMKNHEMILLYEYMPNKSLDRFIFDRTLSIHLDWSLRFDIIMGIARGLLYLHQDSRLRVIHRDLKASNVLLDEEMNPKISDFGLAKIVKGRDTEASTTRVIGTYGYMSPEYALNGFFSVKSDVYSFGVIVLEIISGKRNTGYYHNQQAFSLVSYAWGLWNEKKPLDLLDPVLAASCNSIEVLRCMIIGLLCVQEDPQDRPTMTGVLGMLGMDIESLPDPKEPAFVSKAHARSSPSYVTESEINQLTITDAEGR